MEGSTEDAPSEPESMKPAFIMLEKIQEIIQEKPVEKVAEETKPVVKKRGRPKKTES